MHKARKRFLRVLTRVHCFSLLRAPPFVQWHCSAVAFSLVFRWEAHPVARESARLPSSAAEYSDSRKMLPAMDNSVSPVGAGGENAAGGSEARSQRDSSLPPVDDGDFAEDDQLGPTHVNTTKASHLVKVGKSLTSFSYTAGPEIPPPRLLALLTLEEEEEGGEEKLVAKQESRIHTTHSAQPSMHRGGHGTPFLIRVSPGPQGQVDSLIRWKGEPQSGRWGKRQPCHCPPHPRPLDQATGIRHAPTPALRGQKIG